GRGWSECFLVEPHEIDAAFTWLLKAFILRGNDLGYNPPATPTWARALRGIQRARAARRARGDGGEPRDLRGQDEGRAGAAAPGSRAVDLAAPAGRGGERPRRVARTHAGGDRPCRH